MGKIASRCSPDRHRSRRCRRRRGWPGASSCRGWSGGGSTSGRGWPPASPSWWSRSPWRCPSSPPCPAASGRPGTSCAPPRSTESLHGFHQSISTGLITEPRTKKNATGICGASALWIVSAGVDSHIKGPNFQSFS
jgi:hypothetical protein